MGKSRTEIEKIVYDVQKEFAFRKTRNLKEVFEITKKRLAENKINFAEICKMTDIDRELLEIIYSTNIVSAISDIISFAKIKLDVQNNNTFKMYRTRETEKQIIVYRLIEPLASMRYNKATGDFFKFRMMDNKRVSIEDRPQYIIDEMAQAIYDLLESKKD